MLGNDVLSSRTASPAVPNYVLVFGGAGYIGSHCVAELILKSSYDVVVVDNFSTGHREAVPTAATIEEADIRDTVAVNRIFLRYAPILAVFHFCASIEVAESMRNPLAYYSNNVTGTLNILEMLQKHSIKYFVFSSTAAVYGTPDTSEPITEESPMRPTNAYGETKRTVENALIWCEKAFGLRSATLRYFNACGADASGTIGEAHPHETHLIPLLLQVADKKREALDIFGTDYPTPDGTCIRDYVHVSDLAAAHIKALDYLQKNDRSDCFNLGSGSGHSVMQVIAAVKSVTSRDIPFTTLPRRDGDPCSLVASCKKAETLLGWTRKYSDLEDIVQTAWNFYSRHPNGYTANSL